MLEVTDVHKRYAGGAVALRGVDLCVDVGEVRALLGPNGAGKTTLASIVAGLQRPDRGTVSVAGIDVLTRPERARRFIGLAPQDLGIYPLISVADNLRFFAELAGLRGREARQRCHEVAEALDLLTLLDRPARELSGGEKRRLHTAAALVHRPQLLLLDEPTAGVDVATREHLLELVRRLAATGCAVWYSTHYLTEIETLAASVTILNQGQVVAEGSISEIIRRHCRPAVEVELDVVDPPTRCWFDGQLVVADGGLLHLPMERPTERLHEVVAALREDAGLIRSIDVVMPNLDSAFLALTGHPDDPNQRTEQ